MTEYELNQSVAEKLCQDLEWEGQTFREGQFAALLDGKIIAVTDSPDDAIMAVRTIDPDPQRGMVVDIYRHNPDEPVDFIR